MSKQKKLAKYSTFITLYHEDTKIELCISVPNDLISEIGNYDKIFWLSLNNELIFNENADKFIELDFEYFKKETGLNKKQYEAIKLLISEAKNKNYI